MKINVNNFFEIVLLLILVCFVILGIFFSFFSSSWDFYYLYLIYGIMLIPLSIIISIIYLIISIIKKKFNIFCLYIIPILLSISICGFMFIYKTDKLNIEMYKIAGLIENYYIENGVVNLDENDLRKLGIKEKIYIRINKDQTYYIVNKRKNIVYRSKWKDIIEEDNDF